MRRKQGPVLFLGRRGG